MKNFKICFLAFFLSIGSVWSIDVSISTAVFQDSEKSYLEIYSRIIGQTVRYQISNSDPLEQMSSKVELLVVLKMDETIKLAEKYAIQSPQSETSLDYWDFKRYALEDGIYDMSLQYVDLNNTIDTFTFETKLEVKFNKLGLAHSDILLLSDASGEADEMKFEKSGIYFEPLCFNLINEDEGRFQFYTEIYNGDKADKGLYMKYSIVSNDSLELEPLKVGYKKLSQTAFEPVFIDFDISDLQSGNYKINVELNKKNKANIKSYSTRFSILHPSVDYAALYDGDARFETSFVQAMDKDELQYSLKAVYPRLQNHQTEIVNQIIASKDFKVKKMFLYGFWTGFSPDNPKAIHDKYMEVAKAVDLMYANNVGRGFETDRGFTFLKYGKPDNMIEVLDEPSAPPYEIWIYNQIVETQQTKVKFLFYNPSLAGNDFRLLHSTCRGERNNPRWEIELYRDDLNSAIGNPVDAHTVQDGNNRNARRYFTDN